MPREKGQIGLRVVERSKPERGAFDYRSANVERWVQELPVGNIGETARLVYETLHEVNRLAIGWKERYRFLELLREPVNYIQTSLIRRYTGMAFPLPEKTQRIATLAKTLYSEMALGYKSAIEEMLGSNFLSRDNKALTVMIHRAVRYLSDTLLTCYQTYAPHPQDSWFELHALYLYAEHKGIYQRPIKDEPSGKMPKSSIARVYKQILLLALASPYRLRQGEAEAVYAALARWAGHAQVIPYNDPSAGEALFVVHMDSDEAPDYMSFSHRDCNTELCRLVDTKQLSPILMEELEQIHAKPGKGMIGAELMARLIRTWAFAPKRSFTRNDSSAKIEIVVGATMLHQALARELGDTTLHSRKASYNTRSVVGVSQPTKDDVWDIFGSQKMRKNYDNYKSITEPEEKQDNFPELVSQVWHIRNESAGGYRLELEKSQSAKVQVGELLGLRRSDVDASWEIGVVRWMRHNAEGGLEIGAQVLAPQARPVMVRNKKAGGKAAEQQYALLLPEIPALKQAPSIITPIMLFQPGDQLDLHLPGNDIRLKLLEKLQDSGSFVQFHYSSSGEQAATQPNSTPKDGETDSIDSVWSEL